MTGKQAILQYLKTHKSFCAPDVAKAYGVSQTGVNQAASILFREGVLVTEGRVWRNVYYRMATDAEREGLISTNMIFKECRNSEAMKRVLSVYGVRA
ncbi:protein ren [Salmonella enterica subsp. diarizonae]|uniref:protein ren n=1 Tax=Salmonella enterica TaxID=28901 RepID=UPI0009E94CF5|nr:protein ren [Salmonella enterica]EBQ5241389.1 protein ren [Salmonella enterica subsp. salamae]ECJ2445963.1 protein ren [Salmonella enterica subsp. diarizonae]EDJ8987726.1 protein ren [Salmonella enterica subsp. diarizonae]